MALPALPFALSSVALLDFLDDFGFIALLLTIYFVYNRLTYGFIKNPTIALIIVGVLTFTVFIPYPWFKWLIFIVVVMFGFWSKVEPNAW